ncbi:ABC transporter permease [Pseudoalteromonas sp. SMS1]|uniref:ABC transporter permease n=1 Tax=Pseudoalteromonas sp. SMS1 TaxID=2908894 RepID=UPI001F3C5ACF|nr:ABC transporter permease [Pseudoalteromonas sp. SMS1]MCF2856179.1 ABC transporter permease [Pseudoalteromonas sp. SMS1]
MLSFSDFNYAVRLLIKSPFFAVITMLVLAGGLAVSMYVYSVLNTMLYKPLPIGDAQQVVRVQGKEKNRNRSLDAFELAQMQQHAQTLDEFGLYVNGASIIFDQGATRSVKTTYASWNIFQFSRTKPLLGRGFVQGDGRPGAEKVAVLSHRVWQATFAGDPAIIGSVVRIDNIPTRIVGVMPKYYTFPISAEMWIPLNDIELNPIGYADAPMSAFARVKHDTTIREVNTELTSILKLTQLQFQVSKEDEDIIDAAFVSSFQLAQTGNEGEIVFLLLNVVSIFILLLVCINVGNLILARTNERVNELAIRLALGAPRGKLILQMMLESIIICLVGGGFALMLCGWMLGLTDAFFNNAFEGDLPFWWSWGIDLDTVQSTVIFVFFAMFLVSFLPTLSATNLNINTVLKDGSRGSQGKFTGKVSRALVIVQIVLISVIVLLGSIMAIVAGRVANVDFGMDTTNLLHTEIALDETTYTDEDKQLMFFQQLLSRLRVNPEFESAMLLQELGAVKFGTDDVAYESEDSYPKANLVILSESEQLVGMDLLNGRSFDSRDNKDGLKTAMISQYLADTHFGGSEALGKRIKLVEDETDDEYTIVGILSDVKRGDLFVESALTHAAIYLPFAQSVMPSAGVLVKYRGIEQRAREELINSVNSVDSFMVPSRIRNYDEMLAKLTMMATTMTDLFIRCGIFSVLIAMTGVYGLTSNTIVQKTQEIGLRRALGADDLDIIKHFVKQGAVQLSIGFFIAALLVAPILIAATSLIGISPLLSILVGLGIILTISSLVTVAIYIPARKAVLCEPSESLRYE